MTETGVSPLFIPRVLKAYRWRLTWEPDGPSSRSSCLGCFELRVFFLLGIGVFLVPLQQAGLRQGMRLHTRTGLLENMCELVGQEFASLLGAGRKGARGKYKFEANGVGIGIQIACRLLGERSGMHAHS